MTCRLIKRGLVGAGLGALALGLVFGASTPSYVRTAFHKVRHSAKEAVPIHFEIERARQQIADLEPAIQENIEEVARAEEEVQGLKGEIVAYRENLAREQREMLALRASLGDGDQLRRAGALSYTDEELKRDLKGRLENFRHSKQALAEKERTLKLREQAVASARQQLTGVMNQRRTLLAQLEEIEARQKAIDATRTVEAPAIDDGALGRVKRTIEELRKRQNIMVRADELRGRYADARVPVDLEPTRDVLKEIDAEFGDAGPQGGSPADKDL